MSSENKDPFVFQDWMFLCVKKSSVRQKHHVPHALMTFPTNAYAAKRHPCNRKGVISRFVHFDVPVLKKWLFTFLLFTFLALPPHAWP